MGFGLGLLGLGGFLVRDLGLGVGDAFELESVDREGDGGDEGDGDGGGEAF